MAGNARGKLKEHLEGIHRDFDWSLHHIEQSLAIISDQNPPLQEAFQALAVQIKMLDDLAQGIYATI